MRAGVAGGRPVNVQPSGQPQPSFDYEAKRWGAAPLRPKPWYMNGLKLHYLLEDLAGVQGRVLDVGCGAGSVAKAVKRGRLVPDVLSVCISTSARGLARASAW